MYIKIVHCITCCVFLLLFSFNSHASDDIKVVKYPIVSINITLNADYFTIIELDNNVINLTSFNTKDLNIQQLNNKSVLIYAYDNKLPDQLGKIIINDSSCNSYAINLLKGVQTHDQVISLTNSNKQRTCTPPNDKGFDGFSTMRNTKVTYHNSK